MHHNSEQVNIISASGSIFLFFFLKVLKCVWISASGSIFLFFFLKVLKCVWT